MVAAFERYSETVGLADGLTGDEEM